MKLSKIIVIILAVACMLSVFAACDIDDNEKSPETPKEYCEYAFDYLYAHAYKQTTVNTIVLDGETSKVTEVSHIDGSNYYIDHGYMIVTYCDGTMYVEKGDSKKKAVVDIAALGESVGLTEDYMTGIFDNLKDEDITLTRNADGTITLEFTVDIVVVGKYDYVVTLDKNNHIVKYVLLNEMTAMGYEMSTTSEVTVEYGDQYKVTAPSDADSYETVDSYYDLVT